MTVLETTILIPVVKNTYRFELQNAAAILDEAARSRGSNLTNERAKWVKNNASCLEWEWSIFVAGPY